MALNSLPIPADPKRDAKAAELVRTAHTWPVVTLRKPWGSFKVGDQFLQTPNGYRCNAVVCECPDYVASGNICKHIRTVALLDQRKQSPKPLARLAELFPSCAAKGCQDDREPHEQFCWRHVTVSAF